ncbi:hypothetical protein ACT7SV_003021 [Vibrio cholerae]
MKNHIRKLPISVLILVSLATNAVEYPFFDTDQFPPSFEIVLDKVNNYQGEMTYSIVLTDSNISHSGNAYCDYSICTILDLPFESAIKPGTIITLSKNGVVRYAAPYGPEYLKKNKIFADPFSLGKYIIFELNRNGYKENDLLKKIGDYNIYKLYLTLYKLYISSELRIHDVIYHLQNDSWKLLIADVTSLSSEDELLYLRDLLKIGSNIPNIGSYLGPLAFVIGDLRKFLDAIYDEPDITTNQIYQKLNEIETKINFISEDLDKFYDIYATNEIRDSALRIHNTLLLVNSFSNQIIDTITPATDILDYVDNDDKNREKKIKNIATILNAQALRTLNQTSELMSGSSTQTSLLEEYANNLLFLVEHKKNAGIIEDYTIAYETYNTWLLQQYFSMLFTTSKALYMELSALYLRMKYDADIYPAANYGPVETSDKFFEKSEYLVNVYRKKLDNLSKLLDSYLVSPDYSFKKTEERRLSYDELNIKQYESVSKEIGKKLTHVVLANKMITAYYTYDNNKRFSNGIVYFIPAIMSGDVFIKRCWIGKPGTGIFPGCGLEERYSNCYENRHKIFKLTLDQRLPSNTTPLQPIPSQESYETESTIGTSYYRNTCSNNDTTLTPHQINSINERITQIRRSLP